MKISFADYLKRENAIKALWELLLQLQITKPKQTRFGPLRPFSEGDMEKFVARMYKDKREQQ